MIEKTVSQAADVHDEENTMSAISRRCLRYLAMKQHIQGLSLLRMVMNRLHLIEPFIEFCASAQLKNVFISFVRVGKTYKMFNLFTCFWVHLLANEAWIQKVCMCLTTHDT